MDETGFEKNLAEMLARRASAAPVPLLERVARIPATRPISRSWTPRLRFAGQLAGTVIASGVAVAILGLALGLRAAGQPPSQAGASVPVAGSPGPSRSFVAVCGQAVIAVKIGHLGSTVTFADAVTGTLADLTFPTGFTTSVADGRAELLASDGTVIGREGQTLQLGGAGVVDSNTFHVCTVNGVNYP